jgi:hypothetical protein
MKSTLQTLISAVILIVFATFNSSAQTPDTVTSGPGYTQQAFYSFANGTVVSHVNTDWDLAFQLRGFAASILINSKNNVRLWKSTKEAGDWATMTTYDTTGIVSDPANELYNTDTSWNYGAFNVTNNPADQFDLGWGNYDFLSHTIVGDSIYFIKLGADYKKLCIVDLTSGVYTFKWANLDGSNETTATLNKSNYTGKFFAYYSLVNNVAVDREPMYNAWDLSFAQYMAVTPFVYKVTGVLSNDSVLVAKAYPVDVTTATPAGLTPTYTINNIGYDWKAYDFGTNTWTLADSTVYFVTDRAGTTWKMVFTGFDGASTGNFYFNKSVSTGTGLIENSSIQTFDVYPNPAQGMTRMMLSTKNAGDAQVSLVDVSGKVAMSTQVALNYGVQGVNLDLSGVTPGLYQVVVRQGNEQQVSRIIVQ